MTYEEIMIQIVLNLRVLFEDREQALGWLDRPNTLSPFNGDTPRNILYEGRGEEILQFLNGWIYGA